MKYLGDTQKDIAAAAPEAIRVWVENDDPESYDDVCGPPNFLVETLEDVDRVIYEADEFPDTVTYEYAAIIGNGEYINLSCPQRVVYFIPRHLADAKPRVWEEYHKGNPPNPDYCYRPRME